MDVEVLNLNAVNVNSLASGTTNQSPVTPFALPRSTDEAVKNARILIVDDEVAITQLVRRNLKQAGFRSIEITSDSRSAFALVCESWPDLVLLDIHMQPCSGLEILKLMRDDERTQHIPVIILTSEKDENTRIGALNIGANDFLSKPVSVGELIARVRNTLSVKVYRDHATEYTLQLESDVLTDSLTGVANRRAFDYELKRRLTEQLRRRSPLGLAMVDIDRFKQINDQFGHPVGDEVIRQVAKRISNSVRDADLVARYGGEEFAVILPSVPLAESRNTAERIRKTISKESFEISGLCLNVTVSVGVAHATTADDADLFVRRADAALYDAKQTGRNRSCFHDGTVCKPVSLESGTGIDHAVENATLTDSRIQAALKNVQIAIVDDELATVSLARKYLKDAGYQRFHSYTDSVKALKELPIQCPDLILLDLRMPEVSGFDILASLRKDPATAMIPVVVLTAEREKAKKVEALRLGANDFIEKPLNCNELEARVYNTLLGKLHLDNLAQYSFQLEHDVQLRTAELAASRREAIQCLARAAELRDDQTGQHVLRVGRYARIIAEELGFSRSRAASIELAAQLHDVGKIGIADAILHKPGPLTEEQMEVMRGHCMAGSRVIRHEHGQDCDSTASNEWDESSDNISPLMAMASKTAESHHEKWDGSGYPRGLSGQQIPIEGRITAVADVFDALSSKRSYKDAMSIEKCFTLMAENRGTHFDPDVLDAFFRKRSEVVKIRSDFSD